MNVSCWKATFSFVPSIAIGRHQKNLLQGICVFSSSLRINTHQRACHRSRFIQSAMASSESKLETESISADPIVQYVVVRRDLMDSWPTGSVIAQAVHASVAAIWENRSDNETINYCGQPGNNDNTNSGIESISSSQMHTVVLEAKNEDAILKLAQKLTDNDIKFATWKEQPENFVTALAAKPYPRSTVKKLFQKFRLFK